MGETQGEPVVYNWTPPSPLTALPSLFPWLIVIIPILISLKKDPRAKGILIPLIISILLIVVIKQFLPNEVKEVVFPFLMSLILAQAAIWLVVDRFSGMNRFRVFIHSLFIMLGFGFLFLITLDTQQPTEKPGFMILYAISSLVIHLSIILSRFLVRKRFTPLRFTILIPFLNILLLIPTFLISVLILILFQNVSLPPGFYFQVIMICSVLGFILFLCTLPYLILIFRNGYYREIFNRIFRLQAISPPSNDRFESLEKIDMPESGENPESSGNS